MFTALEAEISYRQDEVRRSAAAHQPRQANRRRRWLPLFGWGTRRPAPRTRPVPRPRVAPSA